MIKQSLLLRVTSRKGTALNLLLILKTYQNSRIVKKAANCLRQYLLRRQIVASKNELNEITGRKNNGL